jgi:hypothetical protein
VGWLTGEDFDLLFTGFDHTAFRLEVRDRYDMPDEREDFELFLAGKPKPLEVEAEERRGWLEMVRSAVAAGKRFERVRVVSEPHSDYIRFEIAGTSLNVEAGEDIRYLPRQLAAGRDLPDHDFWLFDSLRVAYLHFDANDRLLGAEIITEPEVVVRHCYWRDAAWHGAVPHDEYAPR